MSHEVETMFSSMITPWHQLGVVTDGNLTARQAIEIAQLDWMVEKQALYALTANGFKMLDSHRATVRNTDDRVLGVVGKDYEPIQNEKILTWAENLVDAGDARFTTAGSLRNGQIVFCCLELDANINLAGDKVDPYMVVASSHDGSQAFKAFTSKVRVVCKNTLDMAQRGAQTSWTIRHTSTADFRLDAARRVLGLAIASLDDFSREAHALIDQVVSESEFDRIINNAFPMPKDATPRIQEGVSLERSKVRRIYAGNTIGQFRGTGWGVFNAFNEYELWQKNVRGSRAERQALRSLNRDFPVTEKARKLLASVS